MHLFLKTSMRNDKLSAIEHIVADESIKKLGGIALELSSGCFKLRQGLGESMSDLDVLASKLSREFDVVITRDAEPCPRLNSIHHKTNHFRALGPAVDKIANEDGAA